jgi:hypothetical protein
MRSTLNAVTLTGLATHRDAWIAAGLSTAPADRAEAEAGVREACRAARREPPRAVAWLGSPLAGYLCARLISPDGLPASIRANPSYDPFMKAAAAAGHDVIRQLGDPEAPAFAPEGDAPDPAPAWARVQSHVWGGTARASWDREIARERQAIRNGVRDAADRLIAALANPRISAQLRAWRNQVAERVDVRVAGPIKADLASRGGGAEGGEGILEGRLHHALLGQHDAGWLAYYDWFRRTLGLPEFERVAGLVRVARSCGWWWPLPGLALLTDRPERLDRDADGRLHGESGPAIRYRDGYAVYALHGIRVSPRVALHPETITMDEVLEERNVVMRQVMAERFGRDRLARGLGDRAEFFLHPHTTVAHKDEFGTLYRLAQRNGEPIAIVKVVNSTPEPDGSFKDYFLRVPPGVRTAREAVAWTFGMERDGYRPGVET